MTFEKWLERFNSAFTETLANYSKYRGGLKMKDKNTMFIPEGLEEQAVQLYSNYRTEKATQRLVWATWFLAISTIILTVVSLVIR